MALYRKPRSVLAGRALSLNGYQGVAAVAAVIRNALEPARFLSAHDVIRDHNLQPDGSMGLSSAVAIIQTVTGQVPGSGRQLPWEPGASAGHYALFALGQQRVLYAERTAQRECHLYDPCTEEILSLAQLQQTGCGPFVGYRFQLPVTDTIS